MKKKIILFALLASLALALYIKKNVTSSSPTKYTIGVLQTASHPALNAVYDGFLNELKDTFGDTVTIIFKNAQGSVTDAHAMAARLKSNKKIDAFFAIATPAAQALGSLEKERPLLLAAVTYPESLGLIHPTTNVTGVRDNINIAATVELIQKLIPQARTVAILYTSGELNATMQAESIKKELLAQGLKPQEFAIGNETDLPNIVQMATRKADVIFAPTDHIVASAISLIASIALQNNTPFFVSDNMLVSYGPLAARGVAYKQNGKNAAQIMHTLLTSDIKPYTIPIVQPKSMQVYINKKTAHALGVTIPHEIEKDSIFVS